MLITGLLPTTTPLQNTPFLNPISLKLSLAPPIFKLEATNAQVLSLNDSTNPNYRNPDTHLCSRLHISSGCVGSSVWSLEDEISRCLYYLNRINANCLDFTCKQIHGRLVKLGVVKGNALVSNKLVVAYVRKELLDDARKLFDEISEREVTAFAALIGSFCRLEKWVDLFSTVQVMVDDGMLPDKFLVPTILKACSALKLARVGKTVHGYVVKWGVEEDVFVANAVVDMYANCGDLKSSRSVFDKMVDRDVVSWTALVVAYMSHGLLDEAVDMFRRMELDGVKPDLISWNALVSGFALNGEVDLALQSLEEMHGKGVMPKVNTWNGIISGCIQSEYYQDALYAFVKMFWTSTAPNVRTFVSVLPACACLKDLDLGKSIHGHSIKLGRSGNTHLEGSLINMYWKCGRIEYAENIFVRTKHKSTAVWNEMIAAYMDEGKVESALVLFSAMKDSGSRPDEISYNTMLAFYARGGKKEEVNELLSEMTEMGLQPNLFTFNNLISGYQQSGLCHEALRLFQAMQSPYNENFLSQWMKKSIRPNPVTVTGAIAACASIYLQQHGKEVHGYVLRNNLESNIFVSSALVDMYAKCRDMSSASEVFWRMKDRNTVTWNTLIGGYVKERQIHKAFGLFDRLLEEGFKPDPITFRILLSACEEIGAFRLGRELHGCLLKSQS